MTLSDFIARLRKCRLCWRITGAIFLAILATEAAILYFSIHQFEIDRLYEVEREGLVVARIIVREAQKDVDLTTGIATIGPRLRQNTALLGMRVFDRFGTSVGQFGDVPDTLSPGGGDVRKTLHNRLEDGALIDTMWPSQRSKTPFTVVARIDVSEISPQLNAFIWRIVSLVLLTSIVVTLIAMLVLERLVLRPIRGLRDGLSAIAQNPKVPPVGGLPDYGKDELRDVTKNFDLLTSRLSESFEQIERQNQELIEKEISEKASRAKSEFMANMSHELRTPLNAILGFSEMISNQYLGPIGIVKYLHYAQDITLSGRHLLNMVNQILDIERIDAGKYILERQHFDIVELFDDCLKNIQTQAEDKEISLSFDIQDGLPSFNADRSAIFRILSNLIANAVKFTPQGGDVNVKAARSRQQYVFEISDTGIGIPQEELIRMREPFTRHNSDPHKSQVGIGLGLAVTSALVELHEGYLDFSSERGIGTTVLVKLPDILE